MDKRAKQNAPQPLDGGHVEVRGGLDITHMTILLSKQALEIGVRLFHGLIDVRNAFFQALTLS